MPAARIEVATDKTTGQTIVRELPLDEDDLRRLDGMMSEAKAPAEDKANLSPAQKRLAKLKAMRGPIIQKVQLENEDSADEDWFLLRMTWTQLAKVGALSGRDENGVERTDDDRESALQSLTAAMLFVGVVTSENDPEPYFSSLQEAREFADEPEAAGIVSQLFDQITELNKSILPDKKKTDG